MDDNCSMQQSPSNPDTIITLHGSQVQHGYWNNRIYVMSVEQNNATKLITDIISISEKHDYGKIFVKLPGSIRSQFFDAGFEIEATIPHGLSSEDDLLFMSLFRKTDRASYRDKAQCDYVLQTLKNCPQDQSTPLPDNWQMFALTPQNAPQMAQIYSQVFLSYPFPIDSPQYIQEIMAEGNVNFYGIKDDTGNLYALSSCEFNHQYGITEMTDFATLPSARGKHCASNLLKKMELEASEQGIVTSFTIARAFSTPMNRVFARAGYKYGGTLKQNTNIGGDIEDMNVWFKYLISVQN